MLQFCSRLLGSILLCLTAITVFTPPNASAQTDGGRIVGTVRDPDNAVVPGASIIIKNDRTGEERTVTTNSDGTFIVTALKPSNYTITATASGFSNGELTGVQISVGQELNIDVPLGVTGDVNEQVDVTATEAAIETGSAKIGANVNQREVAGLPLNGRQVSQLYLQAPGASNSGSGTFGDIRFSGRAVEQNIVRYDGIEGTAIIDASPGNINGEVPSPFRLQSSLENIQEFRVDSSNYPAESGTGTGGQINVVTKSGSNRFSGSLFEYFRNDKLDAANFFDNIIGRKSPLRLNQFGGSIGGPIKKDKTFFFFSYEGYRGRFGINNIEAAPYLSLANAGALIPGTTTPVNAAIQPFIAAFRSPRAVVLSGVTAATPGFDVVQFQGNTTVDEDSFAFRLDHRFNERHSIYARYFRDNGENLTPEGVTGRTVLITAVPQNAVASFTSLLSSNLINEFKFGYNGAKTRASGQAPTINGIDFSAIALNISGSVANSGIPGQGNASGIAIPGGLVRANSATNGRGQPYTPYSLSLIDNISYTIGNHNTKFGGEIRPVRIYTDRQGGTTYTFSNLAGFLANSPTSVQLVGDLSAPSPFNNGAAGERFAKQEYYIAYGQDEWKIRPNLTLSYGLRYEYYTPLREDRDLQVLFDIDNGTLRNPSEDAYVTRKTNFGPRVAVTYSPDMFGKFFGNNRSTVLRAGFGIYYGPGQTEDLIQPIESDRIQTTITSGANLVFPANTAAIAAGFAGNPNNRQYQPRAYANDYQVPERVYQYSVSLQQELPYNLVGTVAYVGSQGRNLFLRSIANRILPGTQTIVNGSGQSIQSGIGVVNFTDAAGNYISSQTIREFDIVNGTTIMRPFAEVDYKTSGGSDSYNALQSSLARRFNNGLTLNAQYTFARSFGNTAGSNEARTAANNARAIEDYDYDRSYNNFDVRQSFNVSALYALPFGRGQKYNLGGVGNAILGNFEIGTIINARSGLPVEVNITRPDTVFINAAGLVTTSTTDPTRRLVINTPGGGNSRNVRRPDIVPGVPFYLDRDRSYLNPAAFAIPRLGTFGNLPRNFLRGPNFTQFDLIFNKRFALTETARLEFRTEIFNVLNKTNFSTLAGFGTRLNNSLGTLQPGQPFTQATAGSTFGVFNSTVERTVGLGTNRQIQFALRLNF